MEDRPRYPHGTANCYANDDCRCDDCRAAWKAYCTANRRRRGVPPRVASMTAKQMGAAREVAGQLPDAYYADRGGDMVYVRPTAIGLSILQAARARTGHDYNDIVERLLREHGADVAFDDDAVTG